LDWHSKTQERPLVARRVAADKSLEWSDLRDEWMTRFAVWRLLRFPCPAMPKFMAISKFR
jgi:hypothetical protein